LAFHSSRSNGGGEGSKNPIAPWLEAYSVPQLRPGPVVKVI
jgi:hypothetical protein